MGQGVEARECLTWCPHEIDQVRGVGREAVFVELAAVRGVHEKCDGAVEGVDGAGEATTRAREPGEIGAQISILAVHTTRRLALAQCYGVPSRIIDDALIELEGVRVVLRGLRCVLNQVLQAVHRALPLDGIPDDAERGEIDLRDDVGAVLCPR